MRTQLMALERDLQKRERLLRHLATVSKSGQGIGLDVVEKLREERNMLPIYKKKAQDLQALIEEKDSEIRALKRDPQFTRIIELQVEYASWQHETKRLESLLAEPSDAVNDAAKQEIEVHERRAQALEGELDAAEEKRTRAERDFEDMESEHADWLQRYNEREEELTEQQQLTHDLAISFKELLQKRKSAEQLQSEMEEMALNKKRYAEEIEIAEGQLEKTAAREALSLGRTAVSEATLRGEPLPGASAASAASLWALRRSAAARSGPGSLFAQLLAQDTDADGLLDVQQLAEALAAHGLHPTSPGEAAALAEQLPPSMAPATEAGERRVRWLDLLVVLDRLGCAASRTPAPAAPPATLPDLKPLRAACLGAEVGREELRRRLLAAATKVQARALFEGLLGAGDAANAWISCWEGYGPTALALRLPFGDVAPTQAALGAWLGRCVAAAGAHRKEMVESFSVWREDMQLTEDQFRMVCLDIFGVELSEDDVDDLALFTGCTGPEGIVDGAALLKLADR